MDSTQNKFRNVFEVFFMNVKEKINASGHLKCTNY